VVIDEALRNNSIPVGWLRSAVAWSTAADLNAAYFLAFHHLSHFACGRRVPRLTALRAIDAAQTDAN
jgi:hypothetical protein